MALPSRVYSDVHTSVRIWKYVRDAVSGSFNMRSSRLTEQFDVRGEDLYAFVRDILGYSRKVGALLSRSNPIRHPVFPNMYASSIDNLQSMAPTGQDGSASTYKLHRLTVAFETPPFNVLNDNQLLRPFEEYNRHLIVDAEPNLEFIQRRLGSFQFPDVADAGSVRNKPIPDSGGVATRFYRIRYKYTWLQVPDDGLFSNGGFFNGGRATFIEDLIGSVNLLPWHGYPPGTMLFEGWKPLPVTLPSADRPVPLAPGIVRAWDVELHFSFFDPQPFSGQNAPGQVTVQFPWRGHLMVPHPTDGKWFRAHMQGKADANGFWRYVARDWSNMFAMHT